MELLNILKLLCNHRNRIQAEYNAIAEGAVESEPNYLYYLQGILDQTDAEIDVFETVISGNTETMLKASKLLSRIKVRKGVKK